jgi:hypothetical protein
MPVNKLGTTQNLLPPLQVALASGEVFNIPSQNGYAGTFAAFGNQTGWQLTGQYAIDLFTNLQYQIFNSGSQQWMNFGSAGGEATCVSSDGTNYRIANTVNVPNVVTISNAGSGLTNGYNTVTITPSAGGSTYNTIVGGAINTTVTITAGGTGYVAAPILVFNPPLNQGNTPYVLPTAVCTISGGVVNSVTVVAAGAGLVSAPTITVVPQPFDTTGGGAVLTVNATLAGSGTLTAAFVRTYGTTVGATAPTLTFVPASTLAATVSINGTSPANGTLTLQSF